MPPKVEQKTDANGNITIYMPAWMIAKLPKKMINGVEHRMYEGTWTPRPKGQMVTTAKSVLGPTVADPGPPVLPDHAPGGDGGGGGDGDGDTAAHDDATPPREEDPASDDPAWG